MPGEEPDQIIKGDADVAIFIGEYGFVDLRNAVVVGGVEAHILSMLRMQNISVSGDITASYTSHVRFRSTAEFTGTLTCDPTSLATGFVQCGQTCVNSICSF